MGRYTPHISKDKR